MKFKRLVAYIIDFMIVEIIASLLVFVPIFGYDFEAHKDVTKKYMEIYINEVEATEDEILEVMYEFDQKSLPLTISLVTVTFLYFGIFGYIKNGQTLGKKLMKLRIVPIKGGSLKPNLFILREVLLLDIGFNLLRILTSLLCHSASTWLNFYSVIGNASTLILFIIYGFILLREDGRGLHDILGGTKVISE